MPILPRKAIRRVPGNLLPFARPDAAAPFSPPRQENTPCLIVFLGKLCQPLPKGRLQEPMP